MDAAQRFERFIQPIPEAGCWLWMGALNPQTGYGAFRVRTGFLQSAHRFSFEKEKGPIPEGRFVLHRCDVPSCVNPAHLYAGTAADNTADMVRRKRNRVGPQHPNYGKPGLRGAACTTHKLTPEQVAEIRTAVGTHRALAPLYGVTHRTIGNIKAGKSWN